jgi:hypothetical protein
MARPLLTLRAATTRLRQFSGECSEMQIGSSCDKRDECCGTNECFSSRTQHGGQTTRTPAPNLKESFLEDFRVERRRAARTSTRCRRCKTVVRSQLLQGARTALGSLAPRVSTPSASPSRCRRSSSQESVDCRHSQAVRVGVPGYWRHRRSDASAESAVGGGVGEHKSGGF